MSSLELSFVSRVTLRNTVDAGACVSGVDVGGGGGVAVCEGEVGRDGASIYHLGLVEEERKGGRVEHNGRSSSARSNCCFRPPPPPPPDQSG